MKQDKEIYFKLDEANSFLDRCRRTGVRILGVDRVVERDGKLEFDLEGILDLSTLGTGDADFSIKAAKGFLAKYGKLDNERFCIACAD